MQVRITWNPSLPTVASQAFTAGGVAYNDGDPFPWRELGIDEHTARNMWNSRMIDCKPAPQTDVQPVAQLPAVDRAATCPYVTYDMPGTASTETASRLTRSERRALRRQG